MSELKISKSAKSFHSLFLDFLFPVRCISCGKYDTWLCEGCAKAISILPEQLCPCCESVMTPDGKTCFSCKDKFELDGLLTAASYKDETIAKAVHYYKYKFVESLSAPLANIQLRSLSSSTFPIPDFIIPVPLHPRRLRWRGFNQSALLAHQVAQGMAPGIEIPVEETLLHRTKYTPPQMKIKKYSQRLENMREAFSISTGYIQGKTILLIDDIATTCSTLSECARILKKAGAKKVYASVIARQELKGKAKK